MNAKIAPKSVLQDACNQILGQRGSDLSDAEKTLMQADLELQLQYPGEFVAYRDTWKKPKGALVFVAREVVFHSPSRRKVRAWIAAQNDPSLAMRYVDHPQRDSEFPSSALVASQE